VSVPPICSSQVCFSLCVPDKDLQPPAQRPPPNSEAWPVRCSADEYGCHLHYTAQDSAAVLSQSLQQLAWFSSWRGSTKDITYSSVSLSHTSITTFLLSTLCICDEGLSKSHGPSVCPHITPQSLYPDFHEIWFWSMFHFYLNGTILTANLHSRYTSGLENQRIVVQLHARLQNRLTVCEIREISQFNCVRNLSYKKPDKANVHLLSRYALQSVLLTEEKEDNLSVPNKLPGLLNNNSICLNASQ